MYSVTSTNAIQKKPYFVELFLPSIAAHLQIIDQSTHLAPCTDRASSLRSIRSFLQK